MPTYEYRCKDCDHQFEIAQNFTDDALTECPECVGVLKKVYGSVGISFKGSGFYKNDSRGKKSSTTAATTSSDTSSSSDSSTSSTSSSSDSSSSPKTESKPASTSTSSSSKSSPSSSSSSD